jgi:phosphoribosyl-AMP cyclohydrolase
MEELFKQIRFDENGLVTAVIQDWQNQQVLMVGHMNREALERTLAGPFVTFWSRSRKRLWVKGEESGHTQEVKEVFLDCDADTVLIKVNQKVATCHEGYRSDFFRKVEGGRLQIIAKKIFEPKEVYKK